MRPRRPILIWSEHRHLADDWAYVLHLALLVQPSSCSTLEDLLTTLGAARNDLAMVVTSGNDAGFVVAEIVKAMQPHCPIFFASPSLFKSKRIEVVQAVRTLAVRRRGPLPGSVSIDELKARHVARGNA